MFALPMAMRQGFPIEEIYDITGIDPWFLKRIKSIVDMEKDLQDNQDLSATNLLALKQSGLSDKRMREQQG